MSHIPIIPIPTTPMSHILITPKPSNSKSSTMPSSSPSRNIKWTPKKSLKLAELFVEDYERWGHSQRKAAAVMAEKMDIPFLTQTKLINRISMIKKLYRQAVMLKKSTGEGTMDGQTLQGRQG